MNIPDGGGEDLTLVLGNGDKNGAPYVNGYGFVNNRDSNTYLIISCWDNDLNDNVPVLLFYFPTNSPSKYSDTITIIQIHLISNNFREMTLAQIKALFKTGAIPTQADFENLIDKIPNSNESSRGIIH